MKYIQSESRSRGCLSSGVRRSRYVHSTLPTSHLGVCLLFVYIYYRVQDIIRAVGHPSIFRSLARSTRRWFARNGLAPPSLIARRDDRSISRRSLGCSRRRSRAAALLPQHTFQVLQNSWVPRTAVYTYCRYVFFYCTQATYTHR